MWVVKLGGSLLESCDLSTTLKALADHGAGQLVIVPGGGVFADQIRYLQEEIRLDDTTAHRLALRAMEQFGSVLTALNPRCQAAGSIEAIHACLARGDIPVWFPYDMIAANPLIRATWEITSDSLALWLAQTLNCPNLVMIKSTEPERDDYSVGYLSQRGYLDQAFADMIEHTLVKPWWLFYQQLAFFTSLLDGQQQPACPMHEIMPIR